ncbi:DUF2142 domain-containing protein [Candidatus Saccharibacteria bacterium]|nr:DUF2142 domain-containing protein [Candidatus Saccharibacteria bacterium]
MSTPKKNTTKKSKVLATILKSDIAKTVCFSLLYVFGIIAFAIVSRPPKKVIMIISLSFLAITVLLYFAIKKKWSLEKLFLIIAIPLGLMYLVAIPVGRVADEPSHFFRALEISQGKILSSMGEKGGGGELSVKYNEALNNDDIKYNDYFERLKITESAEDEKTYISYYNTAIYSPTCYLPQAIGIFIGNLFHAPILICALLGRLFNLVFFIVLIFFSIKKAPILKFAIFFVSLLPMTLHQAASLSSDVVTYATAVALFAFVLNHLYDKTKRQFRAKDYIIMCVLCLVLGMCKYAYLPICLLVLLIPKEKFKTAKQKFWSIGLLAVGIILLNIIWFFMTRHFFMQREGISSVEQVKYILHHPFGLIVAIIDTLVVKGRTIFETTFGSSLEWLDVGIGDLPVLILVIMFCIFIYRYRQFTISPLLKRMAIFVFCIITAMFIGIEYLTWTPVGAGYVDGIQGRYFLPMLFMVPLFFMNTSTKKNEIKTSELEIQKFENHFNLPALQVLLAINLIAVQALILHHFPL